VATVNRWHRTPIVRPQVRVVQQPEDVDRADVVGEDVGPPGREGREEIAGALEEASRIGFVRLGRVPVHGRCRPVIGEQDDDRRHVRALQDIVHRCEHQRIEDGQLGAVAIGELDRVLTPFQR